MKKIILICVLALVLLVVGCKQNVVKVDVLTEEQIEEALELGKENKFSSDLVQLIYQIESPPFWRCEQLSYCEDPYTQEYLLMYTPFMTIVIASAEKARAYEELTQEEIKEIINKDELIISLSVYGLSDDEVENAKGIIKYDDQIVKSIQSPSYAEVDNSRSDRCTWTANQVYSFAGYSSFKDKKINFVLIRDNGEKAYDIDLSKFK